MTDYCRQAFPASGQPSLDEPRGIEARLLPRDGIDFPAPYDEQPSQKRRQMLWLTLIFTRVNGVGWVSQMRSFWESVRPNNTYTWLKGHFLALCVRPYPALARLRYIVYACDDGVNVDTQAFKSRMKVGSGVRFDSRGFPAMGEDDPVIQAAKKRTKVRNTPASLPFFVCFLQHRVRKLQQHSLLPGRNVSLRKHFDRSYSRPRCKDTNLKSTPRCKDTQCLRSRVLRRYKRSRGDTVISMRP